MQTSELMLVELLALDSELFFQLQGHVIQDYAIVDKLSTLLIPIQVTNLLKGLSPKRSKKFFVAST